MVEWKDLEIFLSRKNLYSVLLAIEEQPTSLTNISKTTGIRFEHVSKYMKELVNFGYAENLTPDITKGKIFGVSEAGSNVLSEIKKRKLVETE
ncbi:MAG TPA: hypothetical protein VKM55_19450 [Candidatus Lokiarchaeia archaeon]|nr:hypothetical protein [Candidatus Lokiarchaeia archaeon]